MSPRAPLFVVSVVCGVLAVGVELAALALPGSDLGTSSPPGIGIASLALVDGLIVALLALQGTSLLLTQHVTAKVQGVVTLVASLLLVLAAIAATLAALALLLLMVGLLVAVPFGTVVYVALWGGFPVGSAAALLGLILLLKLLMGGFLVAANPKYLTNKGFVVIYAVSVLLQLLLGYVHALLPGVVASIGDAAVAIVVSLVGLLVALLTLIGAVPAVLRAFRTAVDT